MWFLEILKVFFLKQQCYGLIIKTNRTEIIFSQNGSDDGLKFYEIEIFKSKNKIQVLSQLKAQKREKKNKIRHRKLYRFVSTTGLPGCVGC